MERSTLSFGCFDGSCENLKCRLDLSELEPFIVKELESGGGKEKENNDKGRRDYTICPVCISSVCISHIGIVYPCEGWQSHSLGDVKDIPLKQIWTESADIKELRSLSYDDFPKCRVCSDRAYCSICLIRNANESKSGDFRQVNPYYCEIARMKTKFSLKTGAK